MSGLLAALLVGLGGLLVLVASLGVLRLPDLYTRMHASTKPASLGVILAAAALALHAGELGIAVRALLVVLLLLLTAPVAAHRLGHAAYRAGVPLWSGTLRDELAERGGAAGAPPRAAPAPGREEGLRRGSPPAPPRRWRRRRGG